MGTYDSPHVRTGAEELMYQMKQAVSVTAEVIVNEHFHPPALGRLGIKADTKKNRSDEKQAMAKELSHISFFTKVQKYE